MKKILFIAPKYSMIANNPYLTNDLVNELAQQGCSVTVVACGEENLTRSTGNISENIIKLNPNSKILKYLLIWPKFIALLLSFIRKKTTFDQIVMLGPFVVLWPAAFLVRYLKADKKTAIIFDIFPIHYIKNGVFPTFSSKILYFLERGLLAHFTEITAMGKNNKEYIRHYYDTEQLGVSVKILTLWGQGLPMKIRGKNDEEVIRVIFGGQIIKGREIEVLIDLFKTLTNKGLPLTLDIYSKGQDFEALKIKYADYHWLYFKDQIPREEYFEKLADYHVGTVVTARHCDIPAFPSKIIDYLESGLHAYCLVEKESDLYTLEDYSLVYINPFCFSEEEINKTFDFFKGIPSPNLNNEVMKLREFFSVKKAALQLME